jgi:tetratricopeptide (TPR) repeat protein
MKLFPRTVLVFAFVLIAAMSPVRGEDVAIDHIIKKLPPPEKLVSRAPQATDPALADALAKQVFDAADKASFGNAFRLSQRLVAKYPQSAVALCIHGNIALVLRRFSEASDSFHKAIGIQPGAMPAYLGLGIMEASQHHYPAAMSHYRQVTKLSPKSEIGWLALSICAEEMQDRGQSVAYAKRATAVAPSSWAAWAQLARAHEIAGHNKAAREALNHANNLRRTASQSVARKS